MKIKTKIALWIICSVLLIICSLLYLQTTEIPLLFPKGAIGIQQRDLLVLSTLLMLIVVIPVFALTIFVSWKYRASNPKPNRYPDWDNNTVAEIVWWGLPFAIIIVLSIFTYISSYELSPFKPLDSDVKPVRIQAVALQWRWLFIYPEEKIATMSYIQFPQDTPLNFEITSDAPMNSFWIPELGGQIYAMAGMKTKLHLIADEIGDFQGCSANISGIGFAGMTFTASSTTQADFEEWVRSVRQSSNTLTLDEYNELQKPTRDNREQDYVLADEGLFDWVVMKYMMPEMKSLVQ